MSEWHFTPDYMNEHETEERLALVFRARNRRIERYNAAIAGESAQGSPGEVQMGARNVMSDQELFELMNQNAKGGGMGIAVQKRGSA